MRTVSRCRPNSLETSRILLPSTITARRTRRYTSTLYIHRTIHGVGYNPMNGGGRSNLQPPNVSDYPPARHTLAPPFTGRSVSHYKFQIKGPEGPEPTPTLQPTPSRGRFTSVSAGGRHTCGVREDGSLACWGWDAVGQATPPQGRFTSVSAGWFHTCGVREDGSLACWGEFTIAKPRRPRAASPRSAPGSSTPAG